MRNHGRGGALLVVPQHTNQWRDSIVRPIMYAVTPPFSELASGASSDVSGIVDALAGLTAIDGATVVSDHFELLAFGVKILSPVPHVERVLVTEPIEGAPEIMIDSGQLGGTRHLSAAQFVHDQRNAIALVASQDGRFTVFAWSHSREMVHAHRLEALLF
jgi:DNA integrity scanning protein DisA with diadenylate cyclase activity